MSGNSHILIVDDEAALRQTMARILQRAGYEVTTAAGGREALALVSAQTFDLVYLDIRMPDMGGLELLDKIQVKYPELPIILFTAQPDVHSAVEALRRGAIDYLLKPLKPQAVLDRTQAVLERKQKERQKRELQRQIGTLQAQLDALAEGKPAEPASAAEERAADDRFLKRGALILDLHVRRATLRGRVINLPPTSFDYLLVLARHMPDVVAYQTLAAEAQGYAAEPREAQELTKWHIHHIRQAIEPDVHNPVHVINVRGTGYRLVVS